MEQYQSPDSTFNSEDAEDALSPSPSQQPGAKAAVERRMPSNNRFLVGSSVASSSSVGTAPKLLLKATGSGTFHSTPVESSSSDGGSVPPIPKLIFTGNFGKGQVKNAAEAMGIHSLSSIAHRLSREGGDVGSSGGAGDSHGVKPGQKQLVPKMFINRSRTGASSSLSVSPPLESGGLKMKMKGRLPPGLGSSTMASSFPSDGSVDSGEPNPAIVAMGKKKFERMMLKPAQMMMKPGPSSSSGVSETQVHEMEQHAAANVSEIIGNVMNDERFYRKDDQGQKITKPRGKYNKPKNSLPTIVAVPGKTIDQYQADMMSLLRDPKFGNKFHPNQDNSRAPNNREQSAPRENHMDPSYLQAMSNLVTDINVEQGNSAPPPKPRFLNSGGGMRRFINSPQQRQIPPLKRMPLGKPRASGSTSGASYFSQNQVVNTKNIVTAAQPQDEVAHSNLISSSVLDLDDGIKLHIRRDIDGSNNEEPLQDSAPTTSIPSSESGFEEENPSISHSEAISEDQPSSVNNRSNLTPTKPGHKGRPANSLNNQFQKGESKEKDEEDMVVSSLTEEPEDANDFQMSAEADSSNRRTSRKRKPTKHYMTDMVVPRAKRRRKENEEEVVDAKSEANESITETNSDPTLGVPSDGAIEETVITPRGRGRGRGTGRGRGRPRGSTLKNKLERMANQLIPPSTVVSDQSESPSKSEASSPSKYDGDSTMETISDILELTSTDADTPTSTPTKSRGRGRGRGSGMTRTPRGSRGGRGL